jgi:type I restriction enzyme M protein
MARLAKRQETPPSGPDDPTGSGLAEIPAEGTLVDFISGLTVRATREEYEAVQVFARRLVEDFGYRKSQIQTRPQFRVRNSPSDEARSYPVDIAVFKDGEKIEDHLFMVVECKKKTSKEGLAQLKLYLDMSPADIGVWFNGDEHLYIRKVFRNGKRNYDNISSIPRRGQRIEDVGLFKRRDLVPPSNIRAVFRDIRNHLAQLTQGTTRDEAVAKEIINILFCKLYDELNTEPDEAVSFRTGIDEDPVDTKTRILEIFNDKVKAEYADVFDEHDTITLDAPSVSYVVGELQNYCITKATRDAIGDAFEVFIGPALRGAEGQFFTPRNAVHMLMEMIDITPGDSIIDPACGSGGFLIGALEIVWKKLEAEGKRKAWSASQLEQKKIRVASQCFRGIDKDSFLAKVTKAYMAIMGEGRGGVFSFNSLMPYEKWDPVHRQSIKPGTFQVVVANPPFGKNLKVDNKETLIQFDLGHKWRDGNDGTDGELEKSDVRDDQVPQLLFLERCLQLAKDGGSIGIVLPESILGNPSYSYVIAFLLTRTTIRAVVTMPESLFKTSGKGGTHTKVCVLLLRKGQPPQQPYNIFMADAKWCGHDSRGNPTIRKSHNGGPSELLDDIPVIGQRFRTMNRRGSDQWDHLGFFIKSDEIKNNIFVPKYYNPELEHYLSSLSKTHELIRIGDLVEARAVSMSTGVEPGKMAYGTGRIPFIRSSDISGWEIRADFKHGVSKSIYGEYASGSDARAGDILMVRDGTYLIGTCAMVTESDLPMLFQSHIYKLRVEDPKVINPWLLFACLNTSVVKRQIRAKQFTQDIIDTLGRRVLELRIAVPKSDKERKRVIEETRHIIETRVALRNRATVLTKQIEGLPDEPSDDDEDVLTEDERDAAVAASRLAGIRKNKNNMVVGDELEAELDELLN